MSDQPLSGKTALITGASRNIGQAIALAFADAGANIIVNTLQDRSAAEAVADEIRNQRRAGNRTGGRHRQSRCGGGHGGCRQ